MRWFMNRFGRFLRSLPPWTWPLLTVAVLATILNLALAWAARTFPPVHEGTPEDFWDAMYRLDLSPRHRLSDVYPPRDGFCIYYVQGFHGQFIYRVPMDQARRLLPLVRNWAPEEVVDLSAAERILLARDADVPALVRERIFNRLMQLEPDLAEYEAECLDAFELQWQRIGRYSHNLLFEGIYLNALLLLAMAPAFPRRSIRWAPFVWGLCPPLLFLPYFLGYAPWTFTSAAPVGGVLYPLLLLPFRGWGWGWTSLDRGLFAALPRILEPLSQTPGPMISVSGLGAVAPTFVLFLGLLIAAATYGIGRMLLAVHFDRRRQVS